MIINGNLIYTTKGGSYNLGVISQYTQTIYDPHLTYNHLPGFPIIGEKYEFLQWEKTTEKQL